MASVNLKRHMLLQLFQVNVFSIFVPDKKCHQVF